MDIIASSLAQSSANSYTDSKISAKVDSADVSHETWTFTLDDDTTVAKEIVTWSGVMPND